jgi:hypothetical protein
MATAVMIAGSVASIGGLAASAMKKSDVNPPASASREPAERSPSELGCL